MPADAGAEERIEGRPREHRKEEGKGHFTQVTDHVLHLPKA